MSTAGTGASCAETLAAAGVHRLEIPTPFAIGSVNAWLIVDDPLTLVDSGPDWGPALEALEQQLRALGHAVNDLELLICTHHHMDHIGLTGVLARRSGAEVAGLASLADYLGDYDRAVAAEDDARATLMRRHGVHPDVALAVRSTGAARRRWAAQTHVDRRLADGEGLLLANRRFSVSHRPGHSATDTVFLDLDSRLLIGGDHLLERVSSNALVDGPDAKPLLVYRRSLRATRNTEVEAVLPGHGGVVRSHRELIDRRLTEQDARAAAILAVLNRGPMSAHEVALELFGRVALEQPFLTLSEILGHVDLLIEGGSVQVDATCPTLMLAAMPR